MPNSSPFLPVPLLPTPPALEWLQDSVTCAPDCRYRFPLARGSQAASLERTVQCVRYGTCMRAWNARVNKTKCVWRQARILYTLKQVRVRGAHGGRGVGGGGSIGKKEWR